MRQILEEIRHHADAALDIHVLADVLWFSAIVIPASLSLGGWDTWRKACPVRRIAEAGPQTRFRVPPRLQRYSLLATGLGFSLVLALRASVLERSLMATLGFLAAAALAAWLVGRFTTGRTFCHHVCPIGYIERLYLEHNAPQRALPCASCTGCTVSCPDLDPLRGARALRRRRQHRVLYAAPGMALAYLMLHRYGVPGDWRGIAIAWAAIITSGVATAGLLVLWQRLRGTVLPEAWHLAASGTLAVGITGALNTLAPDAGIGGILASIAVMTFVALRVAPPTMSRASMGAAQGNVVDDA